MLMRRVALAVAVAGGPAVAGPSPFRTIQEAESSFPTNTPARRRAAFDWVESAVRTNRSESAVRKGLWVLRGMSQGLGRERDYEAVCRDLLASPVEAIRYAALVNFRNSPLGLSESERLERELDGILEKSETDFLLPEHRLDILKGLSDLTAVRLMDYDRALARLDRFAASERSAALRSRAWIKGVEILRDAGRADAAVAKAWNILALTNCPLDEYVSAAFILSPLLAAQNRRQEAEELLFATVARNPGAKGVAAQFIALNAPTQTLDRAVASIRAGLAAVSLADATAFQSAVVRAQPEIVALLWRLGRFDEAVAECRVGLMVASERAYPQLVELTASALRRRDIHLARATAFLQFNEKGIVPTRRNPVLDFPRLDDAVRRAERARLAALDLSDWNVRLTVAKRLLWLDDPVASVAQAMEAFACAPFDTKSLQLCADVIMHPLLVATRDPAVAERVVNYLKFGPSGADGESGTADDLPNPQDVAREVFR